MASPCRLDISQIKKYTRNEPCKLLKCTHKCLHRPLLVCAFFPVGVTCRSTRLSSMTEPSIPVWPATLQAKPHVISTWLCMVRFDAVALFQLLMPLKSLSVNKKQTTAINCACVLSGPEYQGRFSDGVGPRQWIRSAWMYCEWSAPTSSNLEKTRCHFSRKQLQVNKSKWVLWVPRRLIL